MPVIRSIATETIDGMDFEAKQYLIRLLLEFESKLIVSSDDQIPLNKVEAIVHYHAKELLTAAMTFDFWEGLEFLTSDPATFEAKLAAITF